MCLRFFFYCFCSDLVEWHTIASTLVGLDVVVVEWISTIGSTFMFKMKSPYIVQSIPLQCITMAICVQCCKWRETIHQAYFTMLFFESTLYHI